MDTNYCGKNQAVRNGLMTEYDQQYCEKHDQKYGDHLHTCPICVGEKMGEELEIVVIDYTGTIKGDKTHE